MPIFKIDAAALCIAHNFLDAKRSRNETGFVFIEKSGANDVRLTGMDGHKMINFLLHNANPSGADFKSFGIYATQSVLKMIKPRKDVRVFLTLTDGESGAELEANEMTVALERVYYNFDVSSCWELARKQLSEGLAFIPSVLPIKEFKNFDLSGFFGPCLFPAFIKAGRMTVVNFQGLPEDIAARGLIMQTSAGVDENTYVEIYGEDVPDWC